MYGGRGEGEKERKKEFGVILLVWCSAACLEAKKIVQIFVL